MKRERKHTHTHSGNVLFACHIKTFCTVIWSPVQQTGRAFIFYRSFTQQFSSEQIVQDGNKSSVLFSKLTNHPPPPQNSFFTASYFTLLDQQQHLFTSHFQKRSQVTPKHDVLPSGWSTKMHKKQRRINSSIRLLHLLLGTITSFWVCSSLCMNSIVLFHVCLPTPAAPSLLMDGTYAAPTVIPVLRSYINLLSLGLAALY